MEETGTVTNLRRLLGVQQDQIRHISELSLKLIEAHFVIRDHFCSLYQKHEALVVLLEDLGVLGESKLKAFAHRAHDGSSATPLLHVLSDPDCASAILVSAGSASLSALCCASRGCIETLATLLVQVPSNSPSALNDSTDMHEQLQAQLWQSVWRPTLAIWEAQVEELHPCSSQAAPAQRGMSPEQACSTGPQGGQTPSSTIERIVKCKEEKAHRPSSKARSEESDEAHRPSSKAGSEESDEAFPSLSALDLVSSPAKACPGSEAANLGWERSSFLSTRERAFQLHFILSKVITKHIRKYEMLPESDLMAFASVSRDAHAELVESEAKTPRSPLELVSEEAQIRRPRERVQPMPLQTTKGRSSTMASRSSRQPTAPEALGATEVVALAVAPNGRRLEEAAAAEPRQRGSAFEEMLRVRAREGMEAAESPAQAVWNEEDVRRRLRDAALGRRAHHHESHRSANPIRTGELVIVRGLTVRPDLNDVSGTVLSWISNSSRWLVQLSTGEQVRLRRENLAVKVSPKEPSKVMRLFEVLPILGVKLADMAGRRQICYFKACSRRLRRHSCSHLELIIYGGIGSKCTGRRLDSYNPIIGTWKACPPSNHGHYMGCSAVLNGQLFVAGGVDNFATRCVEMFQLSTGSWEELPRLLRPRFAGAAAAVAGRVLVLGGVCEGKVLSSVESFIPGDTKWEEEPCMTHARCLFSVGTLGGRLIVAGGQTEPVAERVEALVGVSRFQRSCLDGQITSNAAASTLPLVGTAEIFCPFRRKWKAVPPSNERRCEPADACVGGSYFVFGGYDGTDILRSSEVFEPGIGKWRSLAPMATPRVGAAAAAVEDSGILMVAGGYDGIGILRSVECLSLDEERWEGVVPMQIPRMGCTMAMLGDRVYICGGCNREGGLSRLEGVCVRTGLGTKRRLRFTSMPVHRSESLAAVLPT